MARRRNRVLEDIRVEKYVAEGKCLSRVDDQVIFIKNAVPGDLVDLIIEKKKPSFSEARVKSLKEPSSLRQDPFCEHFGVCGGCKWQNLTYSKQLEFKQQQVEDQLSRIGKVDLPPVQPIIAAEQTEFYRNKIEYTFTNLRWLTNEEMKDGEKLDRRGIGFHVPGQFDKVVDLNKCYLQDDISNKIRIHIRDFGREHNLPFYNVKEHSGILRNVMIRLADTGELMLILQVSNCKLEDIKPLLESIKNAFPEITSLLYVINNKKNETIFDQDIITYYGNDCIYEEMPLENEQVLKFKIGPKSFFQTNTKQAIKLYQKTKELANIQSNEVVYDLYTGTGTIANFVANKAKKVVGVEYVKEAIDDAFVNSEINNINNTDFYAGDMKDILNREFINKNGQPDVIITDPPRAGMHKDVVDTIMFASPNRIVYVSCNPATQARDIGLLSDMYEVKEVVPADLFPHTHHVENIVLLTRK